MRQVATLHKARRDYSRRLGQPTGVGEVRLVALDGLGGLLLALRQLLDVARHGGLGARGFHGG